DRLSQHSGMRTYVRKQWASVLHRPTSGQRQYTAPYGAPDSISDRRGAVCSAGHASAIAFDLVVSWYRHPFLRGFSEDIQTSPTERSCTSVCGYTQGEARA